MYVQYDCNQPSSFRDLFRTPVSGGPSKIEKVIHDRNIGLARLSTKSK